MRTTPRLIFGIFLICSLLVHFFNPIPVSADETDPPPTEVTDATPVPDPGESDVEEGDAEDILSTVDEIATDTQIVGLQEEATEIPGTSEITETVAVQEFLETSEDTLEPLLFQILEELPQETGVVVLNDNDQLEPLATQTAAEIIAVGDPVWCPGTQAPTPGANGCSSSYASLNELVTSGFVPTGNGTIWIQSGTDSSVTWIDGAGSWSAAKGYALTLQGGWSGISGEKSIVGNTIFNWSNNSQIEVKNWIGDLTINNITLAGGMGLSVNNVKEVDINQVSSNGSTIGISIDTAEDVSITNSDIDNTDVGISLRYVDTATIEDSIISKTIHNGVEFTYVGNIFVDGITATDNGSVGLIVHSADNVSISDSTFNDNHHSGLVIEKAVNATVDQSEFNGNTYAGAQIYTISGAVEVKDSDFIGNIISEGLYIGSVAGDVVIDNIFSEGNGNPGLWINQAGNVEITESDFLNNGWGAYINQANDINVISSSFENNLNDGLSINTANDIHISDSIFSNNGYDGAYIKSTNDITVENSTFSGNQWSGLDIVTAQSTTLINNIFSNNVGGDYYIVGVDTINIINPFADSFSSYLVSLFGIDQDVAEFDMNCAVSNTVRALWASGDEIQLPCVSGGKGRISRADSTIFATELPAGFEYVSGFKVEILLQGVPLKLTPDGRPVQVSFVTSEPDSNYGVMYWDESSGSWILLKEYQLDVNGNSVAFPLNPSNQQDEYKVIEGVHMVPEQDLFNVKVATNFTGLFVLVRY